MDHPLACQIQLIWHPCRPVWDMPCMRHLPQPAQVRYHVQCGPSLAGVIATCSTVVDQLEQAPQAVQSRTGCSRHRVQPRCQTSWGGHHVQCMPQNECHRWCMSWTGQGRCHVQLPSQALRVRPVRCTLHAVYCST